MVVLRKSYISIGYSSCLGLTHKYQRNRVFYRICGLERSVS